MEHYFCKLERAMRRCWDKKALCTYREEDFTYAELAERIEKFHIFFKSIGIEKGDKIALCAKNSARWGISFLAVNTYGAVVVPILSDFLPESVSRLVDHSDSVALFTDSDIWTRMNPSDTPRLKAVVNVKDFSLLSGDGEISDRFDEIDAEFDKLYPNGFSFSDVEYPKDNNKDIAVINYTSGTTSAPKGVMIRYECFNSVLQFCNEDMYLDETHNMVSMLPMGHIYGLVIEFLFPVGCGTPVYFFGRTPSPTLLLKAMAEVRPRLVATVPLVMEKIFASSIRPVISRWYMKVLLSIPGVSHILYRKIGDKLMAAFGGNVCTIIMGGAALNPAVEKVFRRTGIPYVVGYGMTEASPLLAWEKPWKYVPGSCGKAVPCCAVRIDSEDPEHVAGEIQAKGMNICSGYYKNEDANALAFTDDGYLRTGDLGIMDKDGNIFIKGRCKTMILSSSGQNIYPEEVEAVINSQPYVAESVVVDRATKLVALVYIDKEAVRRDGLDDEAAADIPETVLAAVNRLLPPYSRIAKVEVVLAPFEKTPKLSIKRFLYK